MRQNASASEDISSVWKLGRKGGGSVQCESMKSTSVVRVDMSDAAPLAPGFGLLADLIAELAAHDEIAEERSALGAERREQGVVNLATLRLERGLSQTALGKLLETSQAVISRIESGDQDPKLSTLRKLAEALNTDMNTLISAIPNEK